MSNLLTKSRATKLALQRMYQDAPVPLDHNIRGSVSPALPASTSVAEDESGVGTGLTSITVAPASGAMNGSEAAGSTTVEVPIDKNTSQ